MSFTLAVSKDTDKVGFPDTPSPFITEVKPVTPSIDLATEVVEEVLTAIPLEDGKS